MQGRNDITLVGLSDDSVEIQCYHEVHGNLVASIGNR